MDVEQCLQDDVTGEYRAVLRARLKEMHEACMLGRRQLHDRDTFRKLDAALSAVGAAVTALDLVPRAGAAQR